jgi:hypothetical protein
MTMTGIGRSDRRGQREGAKCQTDDFTHDIPPSGSVLMDEIRFRSRSMHKKSLPSDAFHGQSEFTTGRFVPATEYMPAQSGQRNDGHYGTPPNFHSRKPFGSPAQGWRTGAACDFRSVDAADGA